MINLNFFKKWFYYSILLNRILVIPISNSLNINKTDQENQNINTLTFPATNHVTFWQWFWSLVGCLVFHPNILSCNSQYNLQHLNILHLDGMVQLFEHFLHLKLYLKFSSKFIKISARRGLSFFLISLLITK